MKQQIKCPHCNKIFPIEDSLKHEAEEYRKKLQIEEKEKSSEASEEAVVEPGKTEEVQE